MAWTTPATVVAGDLMTAAFWNTQIRDNLNALAPATATTTLTGSQAAFAIPSGRGDLVVFCNNASTLTINGIGVGQDGQRLTFISRSTAVVEFAHDSSSASSTSNRLTNLATTGNMRITTHASGAHGGSAEFVYDATISRWRMVDHDQGAWIAVAHSAGNFTGNQTGTSADWTVASGDQTELSYYMRGRSLTVSVAVATSSVANAPTALRVAMPGGYQLSNQTDHHVGMRWQESATFAMGYISATTAFPTVLQFVKADGAGWTTTTDATAVYGQIEIQAL